MTYGELLASSVRLEEDRPVKDFELALSELIALYRHRIPKVKAVDALVSQSQVVTEDGGWVEPGKRNALPTEPEPDPANEPEPETEDPGDTPPAA